MTVQDSKQSSLQRLERRFSERRHIYYKSGIPEWINAISKNDLLWSKHDPRIDCLCSQERRSHQKHLELPRTTINKTQPNGLFTEAERQLFHDISQLK